jgi:sterol desaturase/sphingolipid hydroxylase (fatty acid hydroxylase superfamily)
MRFLQKIWNSEIPIQPDSRRWLMHFYMIFFSIGFTVTFVATYHVMFLGPNLGDDFSYQYLQDLLVSALEFGNAFFGHTVFFIVFAVLAFSTSFRGLMVYRGFRDYEKNLGKKIPDNEFWVFVMMNYLNILFAPLFLLLLAWMGTWFGFSWLAGWDVFKNIIIFANDQVIKVPTVLELPRIMAFILIIMVLSFFHYWFHRWSHTQRFLWLIFHRPHHMSEHLNYGTTLPVVVSFPFFLLMALPYVFIFSAISKLFYPEPLYSEMIVFQMVLWIAEIYGHNPSIYQQGLKNRMIRALSFFYTHGLYHVAHHDVSKDEKYKASAYSVNIGPGFFCCWDKLFGTYRPLSDVAPETGLVGKPKVYMNPVRLLLSGIVQILYELYHNKSWKMRVFILFGPVDYFPPISHDFAIHKRNHSL